MKGRQGRRNQKAPRAAQARPPAQSGPVHAVIMNVSCIFSFVVLLLFFIKHSFSWSYNPYCNFRECCNADWIPNNITKLRITLNEKVYGQHLVENAVNAIAAHVKHPSQKALAISFHGWPGGGKNYVTRFITESLYQKGAKSKYVHHFIARIHFPENEKAKEYGQALQSWLKGNVSSCPQQLFIFDEVDKMPSGILNGIKPMLDYRNNVDGEDYTKAIFIFLSNTGAALINEHYEELYTKGIKREEVKQIDFEHLIAKGAFNEEGGFQYSDTIKSSLIDHYIPFLPLHKHHIELCIKDEFKTRGVVEPKDEHIKEVLEFVEWGPDHSNLFSKTGCKRISSKVAVLAHKNYMHDEF